MKQSKQSIFSAIPREDTIASIREVLAEVAASKEVGDGLFALKKEEMQAKITYVGVSIAIEGDDELVALCYARLQEAIQAKTLVAYRRIGRCTGVNCTCGNCYSTSPTGKKGFEL